MMPWMSLFNSIICHIEHNMTRLDSTRRYPKKIENVNLLNTD